MSKRALPPETKRGLNNYKIEAAREVGNIIKVGHNGDLTSRECGSIGSQSVRRITGAFEHDLI